MAKTHRDRWKHKIKNPPTVYNAGILFTQSLRSEDPSLISWNQFWDNVPYKYNAHYNKNPSWYNSLTSHRPKRRIERDTINLVKKTPLEDLDEIQWPLSRKPKWWFW